MTSDGNNLKFSQVDGGRNGRHFEVPKGCCKTCSMKVVRNSWSEGVEQITSDMSLLVAETAELVSSARANCLCSSLLTFQKRSNSSRPQVARRHFRIQRIIRGRFRHCSPFVCGQSSRYKRIRLGLYILHTSLVLFSIKSQRNHHFPTSTKNLLLYDASVHCCLCAHLVRLHRRISCGFT
jgi:hypothetical protein